jgi:hypothetical protein
MDNIPGGSWGFFIGGETMDIEEEKDRIQADIIKALEDHIFSGLQPAVGQPNNPETLKECIERSLKVTEEADRILRKQAVERLKDLDRFMTMRFMGVSVLEPSKPYVKVTDL